MWSRFLPLVFVSLVLAVVHGDDEDDSAEYSEYGEEDVGDAEAEQSVYVMEHGFLSPSASWMKRGTLVLTGSIGRGYEYTLSDASEFVELRSELQSKMTEAATSNQYYAISMYNTANPKRKLQASIPAKLLAQNFDGWHDILEITLGSSGDVIGLSYRIRHTLGLQLFVDHTKVHITEPSISDGPMVPESVRYKVGADGEGGGGGAGEQPQQQQSFLRRYWWVILIVLFLVTAGGGADDGKSSGGKGGGGGGGRGRS